MRDPSGAGNKSRHMKDDADFFFTNVPHLKMLALAFCCLDSKIYARAGDVGEGGGVGSLMMPSVSWHGHQTAVICSDFLINGERAASRLYLTRRGLLTPPSS